MSELKKHEISISYTKKVVEKTTTTTNQELTPRELAKRALWNFFDSRYPGENEIPETIEVDGVVFSYKDLQAQQ